MGIKLLKEGPLAGPADKARFEREVEILTQLKHPHIVAIRDSGVAASGQYFVMDYAHGEALDAYGADGRTMDETLRVFAKVCEAVNAAHLRGIIHRDLKPSNIRIDARGEPRVLDFGLATVAASDAEASSMTAAGQFMGSLPWASPEQAAGLPSRIDIRTDVYSLGVILYQMLTDRFPYEVLGNMRDVLDRTMKADPARPSTIRRQISNEVETIVLKCLAKEPERRYQSAGELARDVEHYLAGEPITAKRDSLGYLLKKQLRRHKLHVAVAAAFAVLVMAGLVTSLAFWRHTLRERDIAEAQRARAEANFQKARDAVDQMLTRVAEEKLRAVPQMAPVRQELLEDALRFYQGSLEERGSDPAVRQETARAYRRVGDIYRRLAEMDQAEEAFRQAIALYEQLVAEHSDAPDYRRELAKSHARLGGLLEATARSAEGKEAFRANLALREALTRDFPSVAQYRRDLAMAHAWRGDTPAEKEEAHGRAIAILERLLQEEPEDGDAQGNLAAVYNSLGLLFMNTGRLEQAEVHFAKALALRQELEDRAPGTRQRNLAAGLNSLGSVLVKLGRYDEAQELLRRAIAIGERRAAGNPTVPAYQSELGAQLSNLAALLACTGRPEEARALWEQAAHHQRAALTLNPLNRGYRRFLANHRSNLARVLVEMGNHVDAARAAGELPAADPDRWRPYFEAAGFLSGCIALGDGTFAAAVNYPAGDLPHSVAIGDPNGDGDADLAVANSYSDNVSILLNEGAGECQSSGDPCEPLGLVCGEANDECEGCISDADCDDGVDCADDACISNVCVSTPDDADCPDDGVFCNGPEICDASLGCVSSGDPCAGSGLVCDETNNDCRACLADADCDDGVACTDDACLNGKCAFTPNDANCPDDGVFCNGTGICSAVSGCVCSGDPCTDQGLVRDEANGACRACLADAECNDGEYCNGAETCTDGLCVDGADPCPDQACDEDRQICFDAECATNADCDDDDVCTTDACADQRCQNTPIPGCKDTDQDGVADADDDCPNTSSGAEVDRKGCSCDQLDDDDGVNNCDDECAGTPEAAEPDAHGCSCHQLDADADGVDNCEDACPGTPAGQAVDETGCADSQLDSDGDGLFNPDDRCPGTAAGETVDAQGCSFAQGDDDQDRVLNLRDLCPDTSPEVPVDSDGCAHSQVDRDGDGVFDAFDQCLDTPAGERVDAEGCSAGQRGLGDLEAGAVAPGAGTGAGSRGGSGSCGLLGLIPLAFTCLGLTALRNLGRRRR